MREQLNAIYENQGGTVIVKGESGIGKTRLVEQFLSTVNPHDVIVLKTRVFDSNNRLFDPFRSMIDNLIRSFDNRSSMLTQLMPMDIAPPILDLLPHLRSLYPVEVVEESHSDSDVSYAIDQLLENVTRLKPTVIFFDDMQFLSQQAYKVLQFVLKRIDNKALLIVGCFTPGPTHVDIENKCRGSGRVRQYEIKLKNFCLDETSSFMNSIFEQGFPPSFYEWIYNTTEGNPYFVKEFTKELVSQNAVKYNETEQKWEIESDYRDIKVPRSISNIFSHRIGELDSVSLQFLQVASLIGEQFDPEVVRSVLRLSISISEQLVARLSQDFFVPVMETNYMQFVHPVERGIFKELIPEAKQRAFHRRIAHILKKKQPHAYDSIARHSTEFLLEQEKTPQLCRLVFNVGKRLSEIGNLGRAHDCYTLALNISEVFKERFHLARLIIKARLIALIMSLQHKIPDQKQAAKIADELMHSGFVELGVHLHIMIYRYVYSQTSFQQAAKYIARVIRTLPKEQRYEGLLFRLKIEQSMVWRYIGKVENARRLIRRLLKKYSLRTNLDAYCYGLNIIGLIFYREGNLKEAGEYFDQLVNIADQVGHVPMKAVAFVNLNAASSKMGKIEYSRDLTRRYKQLILKTGQEYKMAIYWGSLAYCALFEGNLGQALKYFSKALERPITVYSKFSTSYLKAEVLIHMGKYPAAREIFKRYPIELEEPPAQEEWLAYAHSTRARCYLKEMDFGKALQAVNRAITIASNSGLYIEHGVALLTKGIILAARSGKRSGLADIRKGARMLREKGAKSYLAPLLCEAGIVLENTKLVEEGNQLLVEINARGWLKHYAKKTKRSGMRHLFKFESPVEKLHIITFGGLSVISTGQSHEFTTKQWKSAKARELLGLLVLNADEKGSTWGELALHLWPDFGTKTARNNFHFTLSTLRDAIGDEYVTHVHNFYGLDSTRVQVDLWNFDGLYKDFKVYKAKNKLHLAERCAKKAIDIMKGDLLPEFHNEQVQTNRTYITHKYEELCLWLAYRYQERHEYNDATNLAYKLLEREPINEAAHRLIIKGFLELDEKARAVRQFNRLATILKQDFGLEPSEQTQKLVQGLISR